MDFVIETPSRTLPIEVKAATRVSPGDARGLESFLDEYSTPPTVACCSMAARKHFRSRSACSRLPGGAFVRRARLDGARGASFCVYRRGDVERNDAVISVDVSLSFCQGNTSKSKFPPLTITPTFFPASGNCSSSVPANATAPDGSTTIFSTSHSNRIALTMLSSDTVTMRSTCFWISAKVSSPSEVNSPSATVLD